jgi:signal transduction histidine kinase
MKNKIVIGLSIFSMIFILSTIYAVISIERTTTKLNNLIRLHQIEIMREHLLIEIKRLQSDMFLKNTKFAPSSDVLGTHMRDMDRLIGNCFTCHHAEPISRRIESLREQIDRYKKVVNKAFADRTYAERRRADEETALVIGLNLIADIDSITALTSKKLEDRTQVAFQEIAYTKKCLYVIMASVPFVAIMLSLVFIRGFTKPVSELLAATRSLKAGNLNYRIGELHHEFGEVAASFNVMAESLKEHFLRMQWAEQIVLLSEMAGGLAHEIKNPLAGIKASVEVISCDHSVSSENREVLLKVIDQIRKIEVILKSLLNFARPPKPQFMLVDFNSVIDATVNLAERHPAFSSRNGNHIAIMKNFDSRLPAITADPLQLQQVFMNLLINSAEAMPEDGTIMIQTSSSEDGRFITAKMTDTGQGIEDATIDKIFQPFFTTKAHGTGLGLAITKELIKQHGGDIRVVNNHDRGVSFTIVLPIHQNEEGTTP